MITLPRPTGPAIRRGIPYLVLAVALLATLVTAYAVATTSRARDRARFDSVVRQTELAIQARLETYIAMLRAGAALFGTSDTVTFDRFRVYAERLRLPANYPGIQGIGFSVWLTPGNRDMIAGLVAGLAPESTVAAIRGGAARHAIVYLEPLDHRNRAAIGYDMYRDPIRRAAMDRARDSGTASASARVTLVQEIDDHKQAGFLIYVPAYRGGGIPPTVAGRRARLLGFVYSPFRANDLLRGVFGAGAPHQTDFRIYDAIAHTPAHLLYDSRILRGDTTVKAPRFTAARRLRIAGRDWGLIFTSRPSLSTGGYLVPMILAGGALVSGTLFGLTRAQVRAREIAERAMIDLLESQARAREIEQRLQTFVGQVRDSAIFMLDTDGRVTSWNPGVERVLGYSEAEFIGLDATRLFPPEAVAEGVPAQELRDAAAQGEASDDRWMMRRDGTRFWASGLTAALQDDTGRLMGYTKVMRDLTEWRRADEALRISESRFRTLVEQSPLAVQIVGRTGRILEVNQAWERLWGVRLDEVSDYNLLQDRQLVGYGLMPLVHRAFAGESVVLPEMRYVTEVGENAGAERWVRAFIYPVRDEGGQVREVVLLLEDVTERRRAEQAVLQAQKLESIGVLAGGIAHDFNNLLTGIMGNLSLAQELIPPDGEVAEILHDAMLAAERAADLTRQLLAYAGKGQFFARHVSVNELVRELSGLMRTSIAKKVQLDLDLDPATPWVQADASQLQQLLMNLVMNGAEAIGDRSGRVLVRVGPREIDAATAEREFPEFGLQPGRYVAIEVRDTGEGMLEETRAQIFDPFFTTKFMGRGLGLAAALGIVRGHGGGIAVSTAPGQGSTFVVVLPASAEPTPAGPLAR